MSKPIIFLLIAGIALLLIKPLHACLWDYDTLAMETKQFPSALELITGKFVRHSQAYYQWRIEDRTKRILSDPENPDLLDDLAVALDKTGQHSEAIAVMKKKMERGSDDKSEDYKSHANLGTFHIHAGDLETGLAFIKKAIEINPDAHFGREMYQQKLVEYILERQVDGKLSLPMSTQISQFGQFHDENFAGFLVKDVEGKEEKYSEVQKGAKGILGMMRFGNYDSPVLLEALGHLLLTQPRTGDAKRLAARAFLKASYEVKGVGEKTHYREMASRALSMQTVSSRTTKTLTLGALESTLKNELAEAEAYFALIEQDEKKWIAAGADVDEQFSRKYYQDAAATPRDKGSFGAFAIARWIAAVAILFLLALWIYFKTRRIDDRQRLVKHAAS